MSNPILRSSVLRSFRVLMRASQQMFHEDPLNQGRARQEILKRYNDARNMTNEEDIKKGVAEALDAADFMLHNYVQAVQNDQGIYQLKPQARHTIADTEPDPTLFK